MMEVILDMSKLLQIEKQIPGRTDEVLLKLGGDTVTEMNMLMSEPKSGVIYGSHQASAPGEAPAVDTGTLKTTIVHRKTGHHEVTVFYGGAYANYAGKLEYGGGNIKFPRPCMLPAVERVANRIPPALIKRVVE